jgi:hypothetical protein
MIYDDPKDWKPKKYISACCDSIYGSRWAGDFNRCECGKSAVDDTPWYGRAIGMMPKCVWDGLPRVGKVYYDPKCDEIFVGKYEGSVYMIEVDKIHQRIVSYKLEDQVIELGDL